MIMGILLITLSIISILLLILGIYIIFTTLHYYSVAIFIVVILLYLLIYIFFSKYTNRQLEKEKQVLKYLKLTKCICNENGVNIIKFKLKNNKWICEKDEKISFILDNYLFKKSFIIARIIRELRYPLVSNQLHLSKLLNRKLKINKINNLIVRFSNENHINEYVLVKKYISKNTILSQAVSKSRYYDLYFGNRFYVRYMKKIEKINESIYLN